MTEEWLLQQRHSYLLEPREPTESSVHLLVLVFDQSLHHLQAILNLILHLKMACSSAFILMSLDDSADIFPILQDEMYSIVRLADSQDLKGKGTTVLDS